MGDFFYIVVNVNKYPKVKVMAIISHNKETPFLASTFIQCNSVSHQCVFIALYKRVYELLIKNVKNFLCPPQLDVDRVVHQIYIYKARGSSLRRVSAKRLNETCTQ